MRRPLVAGNWKMNTQITEAVTLARSLNEVAFGNVDVAVVPPTCFLPLVAAALEGTGALLGAQNMHPEHHGAFTGEVSGAMLREIGCHLVLCGHSERRALFGESPEWVGRKVKAAHAHGLQPILCMGETLAQRDNNEVEAVLTEQCDGGLAHLNRAELLATTLAYEPVWAIGTGQTASPAQAQETHRLIRQHLRTTHGAEVAERMRILYGGSVKPANASELLAQPDVDGALVGGASLKSESFAAIIRAACTTTQQ